VTRVLHLVENVPVPSDTRVWPEALTLKQHGFDVAVVSPKGRGRDDTSAEEIEGVAIRRYRPRPATGSVTSYLVEYGWALWKIARLAARLSREQRPDVVHAANPPDLLLLTMLPLKLRGTRLIFDPLRGSTSARSRRSIREERGAIHAGLQTGRSSFAGQRPSGS
jgi:hypothetical protein